MSDFDFIANAVVDAVEVVPEPYRGFYEENSEGRFGLKADIKPLADAYMGLSKRLKTASMNRAEDNKKDAARRAVLENLSGVLSEFGWEPGDDIAALPEVLKTKVGELIETAKGGKEVKTNIEAVKKDFEKRAAADKAKYDSDLATMRGSLEKFMVNSAAATALAEAGTIEKGVELLMPMIKSSARVVQDESGEYSVKIVDGDNNVRYDVRGEAMSIKDLVSELKSAYPQVFKSEQKPGTGMPPNSGRANNQQQQQQQRRQAADMSPTQKIAAGLSAMGRR